MTGLGYRSNGGIGFAIKQPNLNISAIQSSALSLKDTRAFPLRYESLRNLEKKLKTVFSDNEFTNNLDITISGNAASHVGFGTGTAITLACLEACYRANNFSVSDDFLIRASGRGGTSGIGIQSYFHGGLCLDLGHKKLNSIRPSSDWLEPTRPLELVHTKLPNWGLVILTPTDLHPVSKSVERALFADFRTKTLDSAKDVLFHALMGVFSGARQSIYADFIQGIRQIQGSDWKKAEWEIHGNLLKEKEELLYSSGADVVALSSIGPTLIGVYKDTLLSYKALNNLPSECYSSTFDNEGRMIT